MKGSCCQPYGLGETDTERNLCKASGSKGQNSVQKEGFRTYLARWIPRYSQAAQTPSTPVTCAPDCTCNSPVKVPAVLVTGVLGGHIILPCNMMNHLVETRHQDTYPTSFVRWQRDDGTPRPVLRLLPNGVTFRGLPFMSRASVPTSSIHQGIFSLHLKDLKEEDAGRYNAVVTYGQRKRRCDVSLRTITVIQSPDGPLPENSSVTLTCKIVNPGSSSTSVRWLHLGIPVRPSIRVSENGSSLHLHRLTQEDHGKWSCEVDGARSSITLLVVGITRPDPILLYTGVGSSVELPCNITHLPMEQRLSYHWSKDEENILDNKQALVLNPVRPEDAGTYRCDTTYKSQRLTRRIELRVIQVLPAGTSFTKEGSSLQMLCSINGSTGKERFHWTGPALPDGQRKVIKGAFVDLWDLQTQDSGAWTCSVYDVDRLLGEVEHWVYVHAAQTSDIDTFTSWHVILPLMVIFVSCLAAIAFIAIRNHKRRLSHLAALTSIEVSTVSPPKKLSVSE
ncbi:lymphocyte activation gene 3 protein isoform X2 [Ranitomeya variabilis]|uniref:lymphocyte activation gene 3 protein isoform X2 n=1 Tax=Ranitomeya variabilis TaxID=490064 RepID=UPI004057A7A6